MRIIETENDYLKNDSRFEDGRLFTLDISLCAEEFLKFCEEYAAGRHAVVSAVDFAEYHDPGYSYHHCCTTDEARNALKDMEGIVEEYSADLSDENSREYRFSMSGIGSSRYVAYLVEKSKKHQPQS